MANEANIRAVITAKDEASGVLKRFGSSVSSFGDKVANSLKAATVAMGAAGTAAAGFAVKSAADFEQTRIGLENMLGSADAARVMLGKVSKFAAETPFEFPELAQATRQLVAFGFSGEDAFKTMTQLGDVSAAIGAPINDLAYLMGTLRAQGRAFTIDIRQFAQRGIPIYEYLAKVLKTNTQQLTTMIEEGKVGFPEVQKAFQMMTAEGGKFHGTMAKQSRSLSGLFSTLKDTLGQTARELVGITQEGDIKEGSLFDKLRIGTQWLIENIPSVINLMKLLATGDFRGGIFGLQEDDPVIDALFTIRERLIGVKNAVIDTARAIFTYLAPKFVALFNTIRQDMIPAVWDFVQAFGPAAGAGLVGAIGLAVDALNTLIAVGSPIVRWLSDHTYVVWGLVGAFAAWKAAVLAMSVVTTITTIIAGLSTAFGVLTTIVAGATTALGVLMSPVVLLGAAFVGLTYLIVANWETIKNAFTSGAQWLNSKIESVVQWFGNLPNRMREGLGNMWETVKQAFEDLKNQAVQWAKDTVNKVVDTFKEIPNKVKGAVKPGGGVDKFFDKILPGPDIAGRATGGPISAGTPYVVGEKGPELIVPGQSGTVIPNHKLSGSSQPVNISINVGALMGNGVEARRFAEMILSNMKDIAGSRNMTLGEYIQ